eukprot:5365154-Amphidinium_carterae.1
MVSYGYVYVPSNCCMEQHDGGAKNHALKVFATHVLNARLLQQCIVQEGQHVGMEKLQLRH